MPTLSQRALRNHPEKLQRLARDGEPFKAEKMSGTQELTDVGRLDTFWSSLYRLDRNKIRYTVLSYSTPIAWLLRDGRWVLVEQGFSITTESRHKSVLRGLGPVRPLTESQAVVGLQP